MMKPVVIGLAEMKIIKPPQSIVTFGLGSCVGLVLYDRISKTAGMAHIVLPNYNSNLPNLNIAKCADTAVGAMLENLLGEGATKAGIVAKMAGGAHMFSAGSNPLLKIGERNVEVTKQMLKSLAIPLVAEDVFGINGRTVEFFPQTGDFLIKTVGHGEKII